MPPKTSPATKSPLKLVVEGRRPSDKKQLKNLVYTGNNFLVIVESPSKIKKIEQYLGQEYRVIASMGHISKIEGLQHIDHKNQYTINFSPIPSKKQHIEEMRRTIQNYTKEQVIIATDNDREGEAIGFHLCEMFDLPLNTTPRIIFNEITESAIQYAIQHPTILNMNIIRAQHARQILDMYIGFKISPVLWKFVYSSKSNALSAGRCQTPALRLIYDNYQEKMSHNGGTKQYKTIGHFFPPFNISCELNHAFEQEDPKVDVRRTVALGDDAVNVVEASQDIKDFLEQSKNFNHICSISDKRTTIRAPPAPLNTSKMLQSASHLLHLPPKGIMSLAQKLYQEGHITYMRTESKKYSQEFLNKAEKYIISLRYTDTGFDPDGRRFVGDLKNLSSEGLGLPHEAIRVTDIYTTCLSTDDTKLNTLYRFIWNNTVESCMSSAEYNIYKIHITAPLKYEYIHSLEIPVFLGWKRLQETDITEKQNQQQTLLLYLQSSPTTSLHMMPEKSSTNASDFPAIKQPAIYTYIESSLTLRGTHSHYTESGLIHTLEEKEIGRPSTFSMFVETIQERGYVQKMDIPGITVDCKDYILRRDEPIQETMVKKTLGTEHNKLVIQPLGILCIEFLLEHFESLFTYSYTKSLEEELDKISTGCNIDEPWNQICEKTRLDINQQVKTANQNHKQTYPIDDKHEIVFQGFGPCIRCLISNSPIEYDYLPIKKSLTLQLDKIKSGEYTLDELLLYKQSYVGEYQEKKIHIRTGPYGIYLEWGDVRKTLGSMEEAETVISWSTFSLETAIEYLEDICNKKDKTSEEGENTTGILRILNQEMNVRKGPYGNYIYYKTSTMKKPIFINTNTFSGNTLTCNIDELVSWALIHKDTPKKGGRGGRGGRGSRK